MCSCGTNPRQAGDGNVQVARPGYDRPLLFVQVDYRLTRFPQPRLRPPTAPIYRTCQLIFGKSEVNACFRALPDLARRPRINSRKSCEKEGCTIAGSLFSDYGKNDELGQRRATVCESYLTGELSKPINVMGQLFGGRLRRSRPVRNSRKLIIALRLSHGWQRQREEGNDSGRF